jgi:hypothetical protein
MRYSVPTVLMLAVVCLAACAGDDDSGQTSDIAIVEPGAGEPVTSFTFGVTIQLTPGVFDASSLTVLLNGTSLTVNEEGDIYSATVQPGPPLRDDNLLVVEARRSSDGRIERQERSFQYLPLKARARRITDAGDLVTGPLAHGKVGDYLLENGLARYVIQDVGQRDLYSVGAFGGNIIDAELVARPGTDNFLEIQPAVNIETVINAQTLDILNDGQDGTAAVIRTCGPDDLLDFVNPSTIIQGAGFPFPASADDQDYDVDGCTEYALEPERTAVRMTTTLFNNEDAERGFYVGDYLNGSGELEQWTSSGAGLGEILAGAHGVLSYIGFGEATGVDYAHVTVPVPGLPQPGSTFFTAAGVSYVLQSDSVLEVVVLGTPPAFTVPARGSRSYTRYFAVGDGSGGNAVALETELKQLASGIVEGCVTAGNEPAPNTRVTVGSLQNGALTAVVAPYVTDANGCYRGVLPIGSYGVAAARQGTPYEGNGPTPIVHPITITGGGVTTQDIALPETGRVRVNVVDQNGSATPGRVTVVGFDPSPEPVLPAPGISGSIRTGVFNDQTDALRFGIARAVYTDAGGVAELDLEPGEYQLYVSRGAEYSAYSTPVSVTAGNTAMVQAQIAHVIDTAGFVSSDFHVHGIHSADSRVSHRHRVLQYAGEGVDNLIMTDHHAHTDLNPLIAELGFAAFLRSTVGEEITTWDYGHFNAYPLLVDPTRPSGGSIDWAVAAPPGEDFPSRGAFSLTPAAIAALATGGDTSTPATVIQINHIDSHFGPLRIDSVLVPPRSFITAEEKLRFRLDPATGNLFYHFPALELWNGESRGAQAEFLNRRIGIWFNHLNQGLLTTAIADTDSHNFFNLDAHGARTWTASSTDDPAAIDPAEVAASVRSGRAVGGQGVYVQARLRAGDGSGAVADFTRDGSTLVRSANGTVMLDIHVQAPLWAEYDRIEVYANAGTVVTGSSGGTPVFYGAEPTFVMFKDDEFEVEIRDVFPGIPGGQRLETTVTYETIGLTLDTWFVVVVKGTDGISRPMFPIVSGNLASGSNATLADLTDGNLGEGGVLALGFTNALFADVDAEPGFQPPRR